MTDQIVFDFVNREVTCAHGRIDGKGCPTCTLALRPPYQGHSVTSLEAAHEIKPSRARLAEQVFAYIREHPGSTDEEIAAGTGLAGNTARPRRIELQKAGRVRPEGSKRTLAGRKARTWEIVA